MALLLSPLAHYIQEKEVIIMFTKFIVCFISGIGAGLGCVCKRKEKDSHSQVNNKTVCVDGPVFDYREVQL